ncbi:MAG: 4-alpha-glucanotransferase [Terrimicrobiaceae bacterium]
MEYGPDRKVAGILIPVFSLRCQGDLGIGDTRALRAFVSWAAKHGFGAVQILPVNESGNDNSPYNLLSAMALDPLTIATSPADLPDLEEAAFAKICAELPIDPDPDRVNYELVKSLKQALLEAAYQAFSTRPPQSARKRAFLKFQKEQAFWLADYALHRALIDWNQGEENFSQWPPEHQTPAGAMEWITGLAANDQKAFQDRMQFRAYVQWVARSQWVAIRKFSDKQGVLLIGDVPVGVSMHSTDVWQNPAIFDLTRSCGAPPEKVFKADPFTEAWGQNWGFPLYDWRAMAGDNFAWWRQRLRSTLEIFHLLRVDHALGFFRIYSFPWKPQDNARFTLLTPEEAATITGGPLPGFVDFDDSTEEHREHNRRHGEMVFEMFLEETGPHKLLAEDLGDVAPYVRPCLAALEVPGFKIPQWERAWDRLQPGIEYPRLSLATFATHDHPPIRSFWEDLFAKAQDTEKQAAAIHSQWEFMDFCGQPEVSLPAAFTPEIHKIFLRGLFLSNSWLAIHMISDLLGNTDRFNTPGLVDRGNWTQRIPCPIEDLDANYAELLGFVESAIRESGR